MGECILWLVVVIVIGSLAMIKPSPTVDYDSCNHPSLGYSFECPKGTLRYWETK